MVIDQINNSGLYESLHRGLPEAFAFIRQYIQNPMPDGRYPLGSDGAYAMVQSYDTVPAEQKKWESHRQYIDVQFMVHGAEAMGWAPTAMLTKLGEYLPEKDFQGYEDGPSTALRCPEGTFVIYWPDDAHKPGCELDALSAIRKVVVKLAVE